MSHKQKRQDHSRRTAWTLSLWVQDSERYPPTWAGSLRTRTGQHWRFRSLAELNRLLSELSGWIDPPDQSTTRPHD